LKNRDYAAFRRYAPDVASRKQRFDMRQKLRINRHQILKMPVFGTIFDHPDLTVAFDNLRFNFTDFIIDKGRNVALTA
jgi:glutathione peroxidase-family protein